MAYRVPGRYGAGLQQRLLCLVAGETVPVDVYEEQVVVGALVTRVARPRSSPSARALMTMAEHHRAVPIHLTGEFGLAKAMPLTLPGGEAECPVKSISG